MHPKIQERRFWVAYAAWKRHCYTGNPLPPKLIANPAVVQLVAHHRVSEIETRGR